MACKLRLQVPHRHRHRTATHLGR